MKKLSFILFIAAFVICNLTFVIAPPAAGLIYFRAQHWLVSTVNNSADGELAESKIGEAYRVTGALPPYTEDRANPLNPKSAIIGNNLMINAFDLPGIIWAPGQGVRMEVAESTSGYKAGPIPIPPGAPFYTTDAGFDNVGAMTLVSSVPIIGGPQLYLKAYLQGYYTPGGTSRGAMVQVEAYEGGTPGSPGTLKGKTVIRLDENGVGHNGLSVDGTTGTPTIPSGSYYLVIRHKLPDIAAGPNHMPVVTASTVPIPTAVITVPFDITTDMASVYRASATDPRYEYPMFPETDGSFSLKGGFCDGFDAATGQGDIGLADQQIQANPISWQHTVADGADARADLDGDGEVALPDQQIMANPKNWQTLTSAPAPRP
ncbi:hypothetical protein HZC35_02925 [Candidatus Saganbacteria bacterium]|nr:hypothetical protein [Candidatus Saganbacteria bacterium]